MLGSMMYVIVTDRVGDVHEFETLSTCGEWSRAATRRVITHMIRVLNSWTPTRGR